MKLNALAWAPVAVAIILFCATAHFTRADRRRVVSALVGGALASGIGLLLDVCGYWLGFWHYLGEYISHGPWLVYVAVGFAQGAVALIGWRLAQRFGGAAVAVFVLAVAAGLTTQDYLIANSSFRVQILSPGIAPLAFDLLLWIVVTAISVGTLRALSGPARADAVEASGRVTARRAESE